MKEAQHGTIRDLNNRQDIVSEIKKKKVGMGRPYVEETRNTGEESITIESKKEKTLRKTTIVLEERVKRDVADFN